MEKIRILVVEDDAIISLDIREKLRHWGYHVIAVIKTAEDAIERIGVENPDLVIMDITLAGEMDGIEAASLIQNRYSVPIVYLTAYSDNNTLSRILETDSYGYIHKPIDDNVLKFTIEMALYKHRMDRKVRESEEKFRMFADSMIDNLWVIDIESRKYIYSSPSVIDILGYTDDEMISQRLGYSFYAEDFAKISKELEREIQIDTQPWTDPNRSRIFDVRQIHKDGHLVWTEVRAKFIRSKDGHITGLLGVTRDISQRKIAEELLKYREEFEKLLSATSAEFINLPINRIDEGISAALKKVADFIQVPAGIVYLYDVDTRTLKNSHRYHNEAGHVRNGEYMDITPDTLGYYWKTLQRLESIVISHPDDLPPAAHSERKFIDNHGFRSLIFVPMINQGHLYGTLGFYDSALNEREWSPELILLIKLVAVIFVSALERKRTDVELIEREQRYRTLIEQSPIAMQIHTPDGILVQVNKSWEKLWQAEPSDVLPKFNVLKDVQIRNLGILPFIEQSIRGDTVTLTDIEFDPVKSGIQGRSRLVNLRVYPIKAKDGTVQNFVMAYEDITERKLAEEQAVYYSMYDRLTGLPNKNMFINRTKLEIFKSSRKNKENVFAIICVGIDKFKYINDMHGTGVGDILLQKIASKLKNAFRHDDIVSRFDGDKFMILCSELASSDEVMNVVNKTYNVFLDPIEYMDGKFKLTSSIGVSIFPHDGSDADTLTKNSEAAMYMAKKQGTGTYKLFDHEKHAEIINLIRLENELLSALYYDQFVAYYQPKFDRDKIISGMEALIRWQSPERGMVSPAEFIPIAERNGLIVDIGYSILSIACEQHKAWLDAGFQPVKMSVNLSPYQFSQEDLIDSIGKILKEKNFDPRWLEFEITESGIMKNEGDSIARLNDLNAMGISISIDDFGTGYSSLSKLKSYPIQTLKIDKSFIDDIPGDSSSESIVISIIDLAHHLGYRVTAEGVETERQLAFLIEHGCDEFQGFYFSRPLPPEDFVKILHKPD
jgi:diguanylate cyclase (GGDEF)-like protein/PAS domain S-box-containing protein